MTCLVQDTYFLIRSVIIGFLMIAPRVVADGNSSDWNYGENDALGPNNWHIKYPNCYGAMQSPINIITSELVYDRRSDPFDFSEYENTEGVTMKLKNDGHTAKVLFSGKEIFLKGGNLPVKYILVQMHFHWGHLNRRGSEHKVDGIPYGMEAHIVHRNRRYPNMTVAATKHLGLAVVGFFIKEGRYNYNFAHLLDYFDKIKKPNDEVDIPTFSIKDLLPFNLKYYYYSYYGSLTTPPCYESVIWSISAEPVEMSSEQIQTFRSLHDENRDSIMDNFRPIQPTKGRTVSTTKRFR